MSRIEDLAAAFREAQKALNAAYKREEDLARELRLAEQESFERSDQLRQAKQALLDASMEDFVGAMNE